MKLTKRKIQAASDFRTFDGYDLDELQESFPDTYMDYIYNVRYDVAKVFLSRDVDCDYIGCQDSLGDYYVCNIIESGYDPEWFEVTFQELSDYLS